MKDEHIKIFTGSSILTNRLKQLLEEENISSIIKDHVNSGKLAGFAPLGNSVELFVLNCDIKKAQPIVDAYNEKINS
ncbi:DUF2007 domain-containing protein [Polaribacter batillariae]|uniref:DUF2007 domain-containing protein n=1 Tax=Polaribacter batillariae TaxID=2808900 RepID=A0ABX7SUV5_9FLAO|nr:DUF2007 domain-containing protein [Polaribacter batillariae]QTD37444.1 DUF2007 domain-containing protein [Polaribacter batillariae]